MSHDEAVGPDPSGAGPNPYGASPDAAPPRTAAYTSWGRRVGAALIDMFLGFLAAAPLLIGYVLVIAAAADSTTINPDGTLNSTSTDISSTGLVLIFVGFITSVAFGVYNYCFKQGRTGYTIGKGVIGAKVISEKTGQPIGAGLSFVRQLAHYLDSLCYIGYLWPLWDQKRQTFADKIMTTIVIDEPKP